MRKVAATTGWSILLLVCPATASVAHSKEFRFRVNANAALAVSNDFGAVNVRSRQGQHVVIHAGPSSQATKINATQSGNRIEVQRQRLQPGSKDPVDYEITVPPDTRITVRTVKAQVHIEKLKADIVAESDTGKISVNDIGSAHVHLRSMSGAMELVNVRNGHVELLSVVFTET